MYTLFTIDFENNPFRMNIFNNFIAEKRSEMQGNVVPLIGCYKGQRENSFICRTDDFNDFIRDTAFMAGQESVIHVASGNKMESRLEYLDGTTPGENLGCMHSVCREEALASEAWTHNPLTGDYWIAKQGNPDNSYRNSVAQYRGNAPVIAVTDDEDDLPYDSGPVFDRTPSGSRFNSYAAE